MQLPMFVIPLDWTNTIGFFPAILKPDAILQATASLAHGTYSIYGLFIASFITYFIKLHGTTQRCVYPFAINPLIKSLVSSAIILYLVSVLK